MKWKMWSRLNKLQENEIIFQKEKHINNTMDWLNVAEESSLMANNSLGSFFIYEQ